MSLARRTSGGFVASSLPDRSSSQSRSDRRALKRALGQAVSVIDYAAVGTTAWEDAINEALIDVGQNADKRLHLPGGNFDVYDPLVMDYPVDLFGDGLSKSVLRAKHSGVGLAITGQFGAGPRVRELTIGFDIAGANATAHILASAYQNSGAPTTHYSPDFLELTALNLTGYANSTASYNIVLDGMGRTNTVGGTVPIGLRNLSLRNIIGFNASVRALDCRHIRTGHYENINLFGGAGVGGAAVQAGSGVLSYDNKFYGGSINGTFGVSDCDGTELFGVTTTVSEGANVTNFFKSRVL